MATSIKVHLSPSLRVASSAPTTRRLCADKSVEGAKNLVCFMLLAFDTASGPAPAALGHLCLFRKPRGRRALRLCLLQEVRPCCRSSERPARRYR